MDIRIQLNHMTSDQAVQLHSNYTPISISKNKCPKIIFRFDVIWLYCKRNINYSKFLSLGECHSSSIRGSDIIQKMSEHYAGNSQFWSVKQWACSHHPSWFSSSIPSTVLLNQISGANGIKRSHSAKFWLFFEVLQKLHFYYFSLPRKYLFCVIVFSSSSFYYVLLQSPILSDLNSFDHFVFCASWS